MIDFGCAGVQCRTMWYTQISTPCFSRNSLTVIGSYIVKHMVVTKRERKRSSRSSTVE